MKLKRESLTSTTPKIKMDINGEEITFVFKTLNKLSAFDSMAMALLGSKIQEDPTDMESIKELCSMVFDQLKAVEGVEYEDGGKLEPDMAINIPGLRIIDFVTAYIQERNRILGGSPEEVEGKPVTLN